MQKRSIAVFGILMLLLALLLAGCGGNQSAAPQEVIGIIGAMDVEVSTLKEAAKITKTTEIAGMEF